jgi:hypothetical protein
MVARKRCKVVFLQKVVHTHAKKLRNETYVVPMVEPIQQMNTVAIEWDQDSVTAGEDGTLLSI